MNKKTKTRKPMIKDLNPSVYSKLNALCPNQCGAPVPIFPKAK